MRELNTNITASMAESAAEEAQKDSIDRINDAVVGQALETTVAHATTETASAKTPPGCVAIRARREHLNGRCILISGYEETCLVSAHFACVAGAGAAVGRTDRARPPGSGRARPERSHHEDAVRARRQRRLGPGLSLRRRFARAGYHLAGQSTRRPHGRGRGLHALDAPHQNAHRRHAFVPVLRRRETARRARRRRSATIPIRTPGPACRAARSARNRPSSARSTTA